MFPTVDAIKAILIPLEMRMNRWAQNIKVRNGLWASHTEKEKAGNLLYVVGANYYLQKSVHLLEMLLTVLELFTIRLAAIC